MRIGHEGDAGADSRRCEGDRRAGVKQDNVAAVGVNVEETRGKKETITVLDKKWCNADVGLIYRSITVIFLEFHIIIQMFHSL